MRRLYFSGGWVFGALCAAVCLSAGSAAGLEPNEDFSSRTVLAPGQLALSDELFLAGGSGSAPDTYMGAFDELGALIEADDDDSTLGDGLASGLFGLPVNADGSIELQVTGVGDTGFFGDHGEIGFYELFVDVFDSNGAPLESLQPEIGNFVEGVDFFSFSDPAWIGGTFNAEIDNTSGGAPGAGDVDYFEFNGLTPGAAMIAEITSPDGIDTTLGWFDATGTLLDSDDDGGTGVLSLLAVTADANGEVVLAVSGFPDFNFVDSSHNEVGFYDLTLTLAAIPGDYNGNGLVEQGDLDLVLLNWGTDGSTPPAGWVNGLPSGLIDQAELDGVLLNWGNAAEPDLGEASVPEPGSLVALGLGGLALVRRRG